MSPLGRPIAAVGLVAMLVTAWMAANGQIGLADAGLRAGLILLVAKLLDRLSAHWLRQAAMAAAKVSSRGQITHVALEPGGEAEGA